MTASNIDQWIDTATTNLKKLFTHATNGVEFTDLQSTLLSLTNTMDTSALLNAHNALAIERQRLWELKTDTKYVDMLHAHVSKVLRNAGAFA